VGHLVSMGESRYAYEILVRNSQEKSSLGRLRCRWDRNEIECEDVDWIQLVQGRVPRYGFRERGDKPSGYIRVKAADKHSGSIKAGSFLTSSVTFICSRKTMFFVYCGGG
jgi:hypothetical protein